eukprot:TRINITY_DN1832_c2_g1_i1.p1 TRINITY_DN1832_c2_g1~~TRINITY_DN1832_c2_g1_i1.p1  ORF type:complete len:805 (-),score=239.67 TRINITY_DN1832_c2_g1_i1:156-2570(-)
MLKTREMTDVASGLHIHGVVENIKSGLDKSSGSVNGDARNSVVSIPSSSAPSTVSPRADPLPDLSISGPSSSSSSSSSSSNMKSSQAQQSTNYNRVNYLQDPDDFNNPNNGGAPGRDDDDRNTGTKKIIKSDIVRESDGCVTNFLASGVPLASLLVAPNVADGPQMVNQIMNQVNSHGLSASKSSIGSKVIEPGRIGIINNNGRVEVAGPGRWMIASPRSSWVRINSLTDNPIQYETLSIIRINKGKYGLAIDNGCPKILQEGVHVKNSRFFNYDSEVAANQRHIQHGTIHIIIVPPSEYALVVEDNVPKVLVTGVYVIDSIFFSVQEFVSVNQEHIQHRTIHIIRVPKGKVALVSENNKPALLPEGHFVYNTQIFDYGGMRGVNEESVVYRTITRFRVRNGEIGLAWHNSKPIFIEKPDYYEIDSPAFTFVNCVSASEKLITLGSHKRVVVYDGEVGISYCNGKLEILPPMTHIFEAAERVVEGFLSTRQQSLNLFEEGSKDSYLRCDTKDFVEVGLKACVFYRVSDPEKSILTVGVNEKIQRLIKETSIATIQAIMRSTTLNQVAQSKAVHHGSDADAQPESQFFDKVHDEFISKLHGSFKKSYGLDISNIRIESFKISNTTLADTISQQAIITAQTETKLANLEGQREIATQEMKRSTAVTLIKTQAMAQQVSAETNARNTNLLSDAHAKATAAKILADGEATTITIKANSDARTMLVKAEAQAKAIELKAEAERKRAEELSSNPLAAQLSLLEIQAKMVTESLQGLSKIIYLPPNANLANTPMQLFGQPGLGVPSLEGGK